MHNFILCKSIDSKTINDIATDFKLSEIDLIVTPKYKNQQPKTNLSTLSDIKCHFILHQSNNTEFMLFVFLKELVRGASHSKKIFYLTCAFFCAVPLFLVCFFIDIFNLLFWTINNAGVFLIWLANKTVTAIPNLYYFIKLTGQVLNKLSITRIHLIQGHFTVNDTLNIIEKKDRNSDGVNRIFFIDHFSIYVFTYHCLLSNKPTVIYSSAFKNKVLRFAAKALTFPLKNTLWISSEKAGSNTDKELKALNYKKSGTITSCLRLLDTHSEALTKKAIKFFTNQSEHTLTLASENDRELKKWNLFINELEPEFNTVHLVNLQSISLEMLARQCDAFLLDNTEVKAKKTASLCNKFAIPTYDLDTLITKVSNESS